MTPSRFPGPGVIADPPPCMRPWRRVGSRRQALQRILAFQPQLQARAWCAEAIQACRDWYLARDERRQPVFAPGPWVAWDMAGLADARALRFMHPRRSRDQLAQWFVADAELQAHWRFLLKQQLRWNDYAVHRQARVWTLQEIAVAGLAEPRLAA